MKIRGARVSTIVQGRPTPVSMSIPRELIDQARTYPAIDWNQVMKQAIAVMEKAEAAKKQ